MSILLLYYIGHFPAIFSQYLNAWASDR